MKKLLALVLSLTTIAGVAQLESYHSDFQFQNVEDSLKKKHYLGLISESYTGSNAVTNGFINQTLGEGFISDAFKQQVMDRLGKNNRLGAILDVSIIYKQEMSKYTLVAGLRGKNYRHAQFTDDMFELLMYGNKPFEDRTAELATTSMFQTVHEEIYLGMEKYLDSSKWLLGGGLGIQKVSYAQDQTLNRGTLYTAPLGRYLNFDANYSNWETSREGSELARTVGWGATVNLYAVKEFENKNRLSIELRDLGFNKVRNTRSYAVDSIYRFEGVQVVDFFNFSESTLTDPSNQDIEDLLGIDNQKGSSSYMTVATLHINYLHHINDKLYGFAGVKQLFPAPYKPLIYIRPFYALHDLVHVGSTISYGGFGNLDIGISFRGNISQKVYYTWDFLYIEDLLLRDGSAGQGFNFTVYSLF